MATYSFRCSAGHVTDRTFPIGVSHTRTTKCEKCPRRARFSISDTFGSGNGYVLREFPEHFNISMGCVVKSRAHHRQLQKERGLQDWEPCRNSPGSQLTRARVGR